MAVDLGMSPGRQRPVGIEGVGVGQDGGVRIGCNASSLMVLGAPSQAVVDAAVEAEAAGFSSFWLAQLWGTDTLTLLALCGRATDRIELGSAVVPIWVRHPLALAGQAMTTQEACGGRLVLGLGLAHKPSVEDTLRIPFDRPARHMRNCLDILQPAMADRMVRHEGEAWSAVTEGITYPPGTDPPSVMLAAMGPQMLALAGSRTDGTILWLSGPRTIETRLAPGLRRAAHVAGRPAPRIVASVPVCVTDEPDRVRGVIATVLAGYNDLPSYRSVMDDEGASGPADVSLVGTVEEVRAGLDRFAAAGVTDFAAVEFATNDIEQAATREVLLSYSAS